jgi:hypothetical protein
MGALKISYSVGRNVNLYAAFETVWCYLWTLKAQPISAILLPGMRSPEMYAFMHRKLYTVIFKPAQSVLSSSRNITNAYEEKNVYIVVKYI